MKLPIKKKYFDAIKEGRKKYELRDAHITFVCEETGETLKKNIESVDIIDKPLGFNDVLEDDEVIQFIFKDEAIL